MGRMPPSGMRIGAVAIAAALLLLPAVAVAQDTQTQTRRVPQTTADLAEICAIPTTSPDYTAAAYFCRGFLVGAAQFHGALYPLNRPGRPIFCAPNPPPAPRDVVPLFIAWVKANPQHANDTAVDGLMRFAAATYPCPPSGRRGS